MPTSRRFAFPVRKSRFDATARRAVAVFFAGSPVRPSTGGFALFRETPPRGTTVGQALSSGVALGHVAQLPLAFARYSMAVSIRQAVVTSGVVFALFAGGPTVVWSTFFVFPIR